MVLLPEAAMSWPEERREMAIWHERAHIERHDWLWQTIGRLIAAVFWFHPLVWLACAQLRREAESAADNEVLRSGSIPCQYAALLLEIAKGVRQRSLATAVAMVRRPAVEDRVRSILDSKRMRAPACRAARIAIVASAAALLLGCAALRDSSIQLRDSSIHRIGEPGLTPPTVVSKPEPSYTAEAREQKIQGTVMLKLEIDRKGAAQNIHVERSLDAGLDAQAVKAVSTWRFGPARKNGKPVRCAATILVNFRLL